MAELPTEEVEEKRDEHRDGRRIGTDAAVEGMSSEVRSSESHDKSNGPSTQENPEESEAARIERLGRARPSHFATRWSEILFVFSICMSQILTEFFVSGFAVVVPTLIKELHIPGASVVWPSAAFSLVVASTLLVFGRLGDMWGGRIVYVSGLLWLAVWSIIAGFSRNPLMLDICRALQGLGPAAFLPAGMMLLGSIYRPGPRKNLIFSLYGACAVIGFYIGIFFAGLTGQYIFWGWYFWIGAGFTLATMITSVLSIPADGERARQNEIKMDFLGATTITSGLVLVVFSITESMHAPEKWSTPYIPILLALGLALLGVAVYVEGWVASMPLLPADMFAVPSMTALVLALVFSYGTLGIWMFYAVLYFQDCMGASPLLVVAWFLPMVIGGLVLSTAGGFVLHLLPGTGLLIFSGFGWIGANILLAVIPKHGNYWAYILPSMLLGNVGIDITFSIANIFVTTHMPSERQGLAGAVLNSIMHLGIALLLGFSDIVQTATATGDRGICGSYHNVFWFGTACSTVAFVIMLLFVKVDKAKSDLTADEKRAKVGEEARAQ